MNDHVPSRPAAPLPRFTLATMMLAMVVFSALGACVYYGLRAVEAGFSFEGMLVVVTLCAPVVLLLAVKLGQMVLGWLDPPRDEEDKVRG